MTTLHLDRDRALAPRTGRRRRLVRVLSRPGWVVMTVASLAVLPFVWHYLAFDPATYFSEQREVYVRREFVLGVHVLSGMLAITIGPFQFVGRLRRRFLAVHRALGVTGRRPRLLRRYAWSLALRSASSANRAGDLVSDMGGRLQLRAAP